MQKLLLSLRVLYFIGCSSSKFADKSERASPGEDWRISPADYNRIKDRYLSCNIFHPCRKATVLVADSAEIAYLHSQYPYAQFNMENVRYDKVDEARYAFLWGIPAAHSDSAEVRSFNTSIIRVTLNAGRIPVNLYYYYAKICPPPRGSTCR